MADKLVSVNDDFDFPAPVAARQAERLGDATTAEGQAVAKAVAAPAKDMVLHSPANPLEDTHRLRFVSYQKQEPENQQNGGEPIWFDLGSPLAKAMLTWRLPIKPNTGGKPYGFGEAYPESAFRRMVWAGAHWYSQEQPDDSNPTTIHGHWSVEVPGKDGNLYTRFAVMFRDPLADTVGTDNAQMTTGQGDFAVHVTPVRTQLEAGIPYQMKIAGKDAWDKMIGFYNDHEGIDPWQKRGEIGERATNSDFVLKRYAPPLGGTGGASLALAVSNATGNVAVGSDTVSDIKLSVRAYSAGTNGVASRHDASPGQGKSSFRAQVPDAADRVFQSYIGGDAVPRFIVAADGGLSWGPGGAAGHDASLTRQSTNSLSTPGSFFVGQTLRIGTGNTGGNGVGVLAIAEAATVPNSQNNGGGLIYVEAGALKYRGRNGTVTTIAPA